MGCIPSVPMAATTALSATSPAAPGCRREEKPEPAHPDAHQDVNPLALHHTDQSLTQSTAAGRKSSDDSRAHGTYDPNESSMFTPRRAQSSNALTGGAPNAPPASAFAAVDRSEAAVGRSNGDGGTRGTTTVVTATVRSRAAAAVAAAAALNSSDIAEGFAAGGGHGGSNSQLPRRRGAESSSPPVVVHLTGHLSDPLVQPQPPVVVGPAGGVLSAPTTNSATITTTATTIPIAAATTNTSATLRSNSSLPAFRAGSGAGVAGGAGAGGAGIIPSSASPPFRGGLSPAGANSPAQALSSSGAANGGAAAAALGATTTSHSLTPPLTPPLTQRSPADPNGLSSIVGGGGVACDALPALQAAQRELGTFGPLAMSGEAGLLSAAPIGRRATPRRESSPTPQYYQQSLAVAQAAQSLLFGLGNPTMSVTLPSSPGAPSGRSFTSPAQHVHPLLPGLLSVAGHHSSMGPPLPSPSAPHLFSHPYRNQLTPTASSSEGWAEESVGNAAGGPGPCGGSAGAGAGAHRTLLRQLSFAIQLDESLASVIASPLGCGATVGASPAPPSPSTVSTTSAAAAVSAPRERTRRFMRGSSFIGDEELMSMVPSYDAEGHGTFDLSNLMLPSLPAPVVVRLAHTPIALTLTSLDLSRNELTEFPAALCDLPALRHLHLGNNRLCKLPDAMCSLKSLESLALSCNRFCELPPWLPRLTRLQRVFADFNNLSVFPKVLEEMPWLLEVILSGNERIAAPPSVAFLEAASSLAITMDNHPSAVEAVRVWLETRVLTYQRRMHALIQRLQEDGATASTSGISMSTSWALRAEVAAAAELSRLLGSPTTTTSSPRTAFGGAAEGGEGQVARGTGYGGTHDLVLADQSLLIDFSVPPAMAASTGVGEGSVTTTETLAGNAATATAAGTPMGASAHGGSTPSGAGGRLVRRFPPPGTSSAPMVPKQQSTTAGSSCTTMPNVPATAAATPAVGLSMMSTGSNNTPVTTPDKRRRDSSSNGISNGAPPNPPPSAFSPVGPQPPVALQHPTITILPTMPSGSEGGGQQHRSSIGTNHSSTATAAADPACAAAVVDGGAGGGISSGVAAAITANGGGAGGGKGGPLLSPDAQPAGGRTRETYLDVPGALRLVSPAPSQGNSSASSSRSSSADSAAAPRNVPAAAAANDSEDADAGSPVLMRRLVTAQPPYVSADPSPSDGVRSRGVAVGGPTPTVSGGARLSLVPHPPSTGGTVAGAVTPRAHHPPHDVPRARTNTDEAQPAVDATTTTMTPAAAQPATAAAAANLVCAALPPPAATVLWNYIYPDRIVDGLYLGPLRSVLSQDVYDALGVKAILTVGRELRPLVGPNMEHYAIAIDDVVGAKIPLDLLDAVDRHVRRGDGVIVHCFAGVSRSATMVIAYMMRYRHMRLDAAYRHVRARRGVIRPNAGFWQQLLELDRTLYPEAVQPSSWGTLMDTVDKEETAIAQRGTA